MGALVLLFSCITLIVFSPRTRTDAFSSTSISSHRARLKPSFSSANSLYANNARRQNVDLKMSVGGVVITGGAAGMTLPHLPSFSSQIICFLL